jgi:hypothetical protein
MDIYSTNLEAPYSNGKGCKIAALRSRDQPLMWTPSSEPLRVPFPPNSFDSSTTRLGLCFVTTEGIEAAAEQLDERIVDLAWRNSSEIWRKELTRDECKAMYNPIIKRNDKYKHGLLRTKICTTGPKTIRCWTSTGEPRDLPKDWRGIEAIPMIKVVGVYIQAREFGVILDTTDLKITETQTTCPF